MAQSKYSITISDRTDRNRSPIAGSGIFGKSTNNGLTEGNVNALKSVMAVKGVVAPFVDQVVSYKIQTISLRTGAQEQQDRLSLVYSVGKQASSVLMSTAIGAATGGGVGAIVGLAVGVAHTAISYMQKSDELRTQRALENVGLRYMNNRAGGSVASFSGSRLKNQ